MTRNFIKNKQGIVWLWIVAFFLTIPVCVLFYTLLTYALNLILDQTSSMYTLTGTMALAWTATQFIISYLLAFVVIFAIFWVIVNSKDPRVMFAPLIKNIKTLQSNRQGIVVGMIVMITSVIIVALLYALSLPALNIIWDYVSPNLPANLTNQMTLVNNVCGWTLLILVIGCLAYGLALAMKRDPYDTPM